MILHNLWTTPFQVSTFKEWHCGKCNIGLLELDKECFHSFENGETLTSKNDVDFDYDWIVYRFSAVLKCNNKNCCEISILTGNGYMDSYHFEGNNGYEEEWFARYQPEYCSPPPAVFKIPIEAPQSIKEILLSSFTIFFSDTSSAANKLRKCIEEILTHKKVSKNGNLKARIQRLCNNENLNITHYINAIKYIGDQGSHSGTKYKKLTIEDILNGYDLIEFLLIQLYDPPHIKKNELEEISKKYQ